MNYKGVILRKCNTIFDGCKISQMLNLDFAKRVIIETRKQEWVDSPASGVRRKLLEREEA